MERKLAVITGADGGMGTEITRAVALAGYRVIMACCNREKAEAKREWLVKETGNPEVEVMYIDLASLASVADFAERLCARGERLALLMNNAGTMLAVNAGKAFTAVKHKRIHKRAGPVSDCRMHDHAARFIHHNDILILIDDIEWNILRFDV